MNVYSRRRFITLGTKIITGSGLALGAHPLTALALQNQDLAPQVSDYRALVCVYLNGGCDGFSLFVPTGSYEYDTYAHSRGDLAVDYNRLVALGGGSAPVGLHDSAAALQPLYDEGHLAMIANVGTLIEPLTREQYVNKAAKIPAQLFSHSDQAIQWQQLQSRGRAQEGWGAKAAHYLSDSQTRDYLTAVSLGGANYWQSGRDQRPFTLKASGINEYQGMDPTDAWQRPRAEAFERMLRLNREHVFSSTYRDLQLHALNLTGELGRALEANQAMFSDAPEPGTLGEKLSMVAQLIAAHDTLGMRRQIFYVNMGGFDVHDHQNKRTPELFAELASGLSYFQNKLGELGQSNAVTTFTASDFGRSLLSNGDGTDHGWGNHLMAMGGAVNGGRIIGTLPTLDAEGHDAVDRGRVLPALAAVQYAAPLLEWLGLSELQLNDALPLLSGFNEPRLDLMKST